MAIYHSSPQEHADRLEARISGVKMDSAVMKVAMYLSRGTVDRLGSDLLRLDMKHDDPWRIHGIIIDGEAGREVWVEDVGREYSS
jgi:hypothetical protein